ncbi:hypothetical protein [Enterococcus rotai]|uniref:hypothetical protein n=1 Tax=Enterococcus rotai TaxID=118060 RepID=UPI0032B4E1DF
MKKVFVLGLSLVSLLLLCGCDNIVSQEKWNNLELGMSPKQVEKVVGKPKKVISDADPILEEIYEMYSTGQDLLATGKSLGVDDSDSLEKKQDDISNLYTLAKRSEHLKEYIYNVKDAKEKQAFFVDGRLEYFNYLIKD